MLSRINFAKTAPGALEAMRGLEHYINQSSGLEPSLRELIKTRASQLNGCAYCIDSHTKDARAAGETEQRLYALPAWRETPFFTPRERAALAFAESVTLVAQGHVTREDYDAVAAEFGPDEIAALLALSATISASSAAISAATRAWAPGSYEVE